MTDAEEQTSPYLQELDPAPVYDETPDLEYGDDSKTSNGAEAGQWKDERSHTYKLGLGGHSWEYWLSSIQRYSTYPPTVFLGLHFTNTSLIPLATGSVSSSETFLLLTRPIYQSPSLEPLFVTIPIVAHIASGVALRFVRQSRRARLYGAETPEQRKKLRSKNPTSVQSLLGYAFLPLLGAHVLVNRLVPLHVDGGSSGVGLGYVAHGIAKAPWSMGIGYAVFVGVGVWHFVGGWAWWFGWREVIRFERRKGKSSGANGGYLGSPEGAELMKRKTRRRWIVNGISIVGTGLWLAGGLGQFSTASKPFEEVFGFSGRMLVLRLCSRLAVRVKCVIANPLLVRPRFPLPDQHAPRQNPTSQCRRRMASTEAAPEKGTLCSAPKAGQIIQHEDKEFETIKEGLAYILVPRSTGDSSSTTKKNANSAEGQRQDVFYNPIQQFNRDLSVLAIRAFGEHVIAAKTEKHEARIRNKSKRDSGKKRKREGDEAKDGELPGEPPAKKTCDDGNGLTKLASNNTEASSAKKEGDSGIAPGGPWKPTFSILDALSATGLRALRYAKEIPFATRVVANDLSPLAIESMKLNVQHNGVEDIVQPHRGDACAYMYSAGAPKSDTNATSGKFDAVDLDPYGTAAPFMDAAIQSVGDGGLLCITCTDAGVFAGAGYPEKTFALYGGSPIRGPHSHEGGLRLILNAIATSAAKYGISIEPLLSLSIDFYARVFVRIHKSPSETKLLASKTMVIYHCAHGCGSWKTQPLSEYKQKEGKTGIPFNTYKLSQGPTAAPNCDQCGFKTHLSGPMWSGPLHNPHFIHRILSLLKDSDKTTYPTFNRVEGMLTTALEEDLNLGGGSSKEDSSDHESGPDKNDDTQKPPLSFIPQTDASLVEPHPFFVMPSHLCKIVHTATIPENLLRGALRHLGYRSTRSHIKPNSIRTDAPWSVIWEIIREWVRQKSPIKPTALSEGTAGAGIMRRSREKLNPANGTGEDLRSLKRDILGAVESGRSLADLTTKIEAALYRSGARRAGEATEDSKMEGEKEGEESHPPSPGPKSEGDKPLHIPDPSTLEIVFDEELGRKAVAAQRKRLVRYQINPRANWGPLSRASKGNS